MAADMKEVMREWIGLKNQLKAARADISVLNRREKELKALIQNFMKSQTNDENEKVEVKVDDQKVSMSSKNSRGSITKEVILTGLRSFFGGNETQVEGAFQAILDATPVKESNVVSVKKWG